MTGRNAVGVAWVLSVLALAAPDARAQAVCSAPHSSPTLTQGGAIGTLPAGSGWVQLSLYGQRATEHFTPAGHRQAFLAGSTFDTRSVFLTGAVGLAPGVEVWAQVPTHRLTVDATSGRSASSGIGDVRVAARLGAELAGWTVPVAVRVGAKVPGSDFPVDATVLPLTEGQKDVEVSVESGRALRGEALYVVGWLGYRWRGANDEAERQPGNERYGHVAVGGSARALSWEIALDGLWGGAPLAQRLRLLDERRRLVQVIPTLGVGAGPGRLEVTALVPVSGRNLPAGFGLSVGYRATWGL